MSRRYIIPIAGLLGIAAAYLATMQPVRVAVTNVWKRLPLVHSAPVHLVFVGDIMLSRSVGDTMAARNDWIWPFANVAQEIAEADLVFGNLESVISDAGTTHGCTYCFRADPQAIQGLLHAGFDVLSVANNHAWDYGAEAFVDSLERLTATGIVPVGGGSGSEQEPAILTTNSVRVAYLAYTDLVPASVCATAVRTGVYCFDAERMASDIVHARHMADIVVVSFHTGEEYQSRTPTQERRFQAAIDAGADLVIGHHSHITQDLERYRDGWIAYSLGNFIFDQSWSPETMRGLWLDVTVADGKIATVATRSVDISRSYQASLP